MLDPSDLRCFVSVAALGSVSAAARQLRMPKSSVSRALARLEDRVGALLLERSTRQLRLTHAGELLRPHAQHILTALDEAEGILSGVSDVPQGLLTVNTTQAFAEAMVAPMLPSLFASYPAMQVALEVESRQVDPIAAAADLVIRIGPLKDSSLIARRLGAVQVWLCASPVYLARRKPPSTVEDLDGHDLIARHDQRNEWSFPGDDNRLRHVPIRPRAIMTDPGSTLAAVCAGAGIGRVPDYLAMPAIAQRRLVRVLPDIEPHIVEAHALYPAHRIQSTKVRVFIDALVVRLASLRDVDG